MPRHPLARLGLFILCALASIQLAGCTAIGFGVGALVDMSNGKGGADRLSTVATGTTVTIWLRDGRVVHGQFQGSADSLSENPPPPAPGGGKQSATPLRAVLLLGTSQGTQQIPVQNVSRVSVPVARGKLIGFLSGLGVDVLLLLVIRAATAEWPG